MRTILFCILTLFIIGGCKNEPKSNENNNVEQIDSTAIAIAVQPTFECLPLMVAQENGLFDSCDVKVNIKLFTSQADCDNAMSENVANGMITDIIRGVFWENENKRNLNFVTWTNTHHMLVTSKKARVKELSQMTDKLMAMTRNSYTDLLADSAIIRAGKTPEEMFKVQINDQEIRLNMILESKMDAAFLQHPYAAQAISKGGSVIMHGGKYQTGILAFNEKIDSISVSKILKAYDQACSLINNKGIMYFAPIVEKYTKKDITKWGKIIGDIKFKSSNNVDDKARNRAQVWLKNN